MDAYLEQLFAEAYEREIEQEENVVRSLSIIAAIASVTLLVLREFGDGVPPFDWSPWAWVIHGLIVAIGVAFFYVLVFLFVALRPRRYEQPRNPLAIRASAEELVAFYENEGIEAGEAEGMALRDLRQEMIEQLALVATNNRRHNLARQRARSRAFNGLVMALALAFALVGTIYFEETVIAAGRQERGAVTSE